MPEPQLSTWEVDELADSVQVPGPSSGTSTDSKPGVSVPESSPLIAFAFEVGAIVGTVDVVSPEEVLATECVVLVVLDVTMIGVDGTVVTTVGIVVVAFGARVVTGDVEEGGGDEAPWSPGADADVKVKTRTNKRRGLDHISR